MTESDDQPPSGNRWEPAGATAPEASELHEAEAAPVATGTAAAAPPSRPTSWTRARAGVAGGAAAVLLAGLVGGFAVGRATSGTDGWPGPQQGVPTGVDGDGRGPQGGPGGGPMMGQPPDGGQVPEMPGQDDGQQDDDGTDSSDT
jgi:hypothetical protein